MASCLIQRLPTIQGEATRIQQVFQNLISNAVKYSDKDKGNVVIDVVEDSNDWTFSITDNGRGIKKDDFEKIFQIFKTVQPSDSIDSTGVGLSIVKKIVERNEGKIWVESEIGKGSTFYFTIPKGGVQQN